MIRPLGASTAVLRQPQHIPSADTRPLAQSLAEPHPDDNHQNSGGGGQFVKYLTKTGYVYGFKLQFATKIVTATSWFSTATTI